MSKTEFVCAALNASGNRCRSLAVAETEYWRCAKHADWYDHATRKEIERLALLEIEEAISESRYPDAEDLETRRTGSRGRNRPETA